jgi:hypothetical protein
MGRPRIRTEEDIKAYKKKWAKYQRASIRRYGISPQEYDAMLEEQGGCAICGGESGIAGKRHHIDHCHETGIVRGILCGPCNVAIGMMKNDPRRLIAAAEYLYRHMAQLLNSLLD